MTGKITENRQVFLVDTTLRDGAQSPSVVFSDEDKLKVAGWLYELGIRKIEAGIPVMGESECECMRILKKCYPAMEMTGWCRPLAKDIAAARNARCDSVHLSFPVSQRHMKIVGMSEERVLQSVKWFTHYASQWFRSVSVGAQDASRADRPFLREYVAAAMNAGVSRVRIADTVGIFNPLQTAELVSDLHNEIPGCVLEFHAHNDLGMATANTITALQAGASFASVTVGGVGERAGNAALEEVVMALDLSGFETGIQTALLTNVCKKVAGILNTPIPSQKPIVGSDIFTHESGIHCHGMRKDTEAYEPFPSKSIGHLDTKLVVGSHSGCAAIQHNLEKMGIEVDKNQAKLILEYIRPIVQEKKRVLTNKELLNIHYDLFQNGTRMFRQVEALQ